MFLRCSLYLLQSLESDFAAVIQEKDDVIRNLTRELAESSAHMQHLDRGGSDRSRCVCTSMLTGTVLPRAFLLHFSDVHFSLASVSASHWNSRFSIGGGGSVTGGAYDDDVDQPGCGTFVFRATISHSPFSVSEQHVRWLQEQVPSPSNHTFSLLF